jgi:hypothetical protein
MSKRNQVPEIDKAEALTRIAKWMGWKVKPTPSGATRFYPSDRSSYLIDAAHSSYEFDPFTNLADAFALQVEIERRGLADEYCCRVMETRVDQIGKDMPDAWRLVHATAELAVIDHEASRAV